jgi:hypothetical protein
MAVPISNLTATFTSTNGNTGIGMTITDIVNNSNSNLINFVVNTESKFRVDINGTVYSGNNAINNKFVVGWLLS